jgi:hypothetical protein
MVTQVSKNRDGGEVDEFVVHLQRDVHAGYPPMEEFTLQLAKNWPKIPSKMLWSSSVEPRGQAGGHFRSLAAIFPCIFRRSSF